jgi:hypothetical protein
MRTKIKLMPLLFLTFILTPNLIIAQVKDSVSMSAKIDSIYNLQKKMYTESKNTPLSDKKYGIELNPFRFLYLDKAFTLSGTFSLFNLDRKAEIAFPFYFQNPKESNELSEFTIDCHYRYFLGNSQNGFYLSGFVRYAYLEGVTGENVLFDNRIYGVKGTENKIGIGFGIGFRKFSYRGLYWGASLSFGRYFIGRNDRFAGEFLLIDDDNEIIVDIELLKFGWAF